jgi:hypothetical protein
VRISGQIEASLPLKHDLLGSPRNTGAAARVALAIDVRRKEESDARSPLRRDVRRAGGTFRSAASYAVQPRWAAPAACLRRARADVAGTPATTACPDIPAWSRSLGTPILAAPYGIPSKYNERSAPAKPRAHADAAFVRGVHAAQNLFGIITPSGLRRAPSRQRSRHRSHRHRLITVWCVRHAC